MEPSLNQVDIAASDKKGSMAKRGEGRKREKIPEGRKAEKPMYEVEDILGKKYRKGKVEYLVKWAGWSEAENSWEPRVNLKSCPAVIKSFEDRLKAAKNSSGSHRQGRAATTPSGSKALAGVEEEEIDINMKISELKVSAAAATNGETARSQMPQQPGPTNDTLLSGRLTGAKKRKSSIPKRFVLEAGASTADATQDVSATNQVILNGTPTPLYGNSPIIELLGIEDNNVEDKLILIRAKRADGTVITVDSKHLRANYPNLVINFYERHVKI